MHIGLPILQFTTVSSFPLIILIGIILVCLLNNESIFLNIIVIDSIKINIIFIKIIVFKILIFLDTNGFVRVKND